VQAKGLWGDFDNSARFPALEAGQAGGGRCRFC
jgi:hypothetical protein